MISLSPRWKTMYPDAFVGILAMRHVANPPQHEELDRRKEMIEQELQARFGSLDRAALKKLPLLQAYATYYKRFEKTYHVQLQLESVVFKGKSIPRVAALVETMFMAELKNMLLTAGHDLALLQQPLKIDAATGDERYVMMSGQEQTLKAGDMYIADAQGILSSIIYGPDQRTQITQQTRSVLFTIYAPPGIPKDAVSAHLQDIQTYVQLVSPAAETLHISVHGGEEYF